MLWVLPLHTRGEPCIRGDIRFWWTPPGLSLGQPAVLAPGGRRRVARALRSAQDAGDADAAAGVAAVLGQLGGEVQAADAGLLAVLVGEQVGRDDPDDLELEPVRVLAVQRLRRPVVRRPDQRAVLAQGRGQLLEVTERVDLPREVIEADRRPARAGRPGLHADLEQPEV